MDQWNRPTLRDFLKKEEVIVIKKEQRRMYRINWKTFFKNLYDLVAFWKPKSKRLRYRRSAILSSEVDKNELGTLRMPVINESTSGRNNMQE